MYGDGDPGLSSTLHYCPVQYVVILRSHVLENKILATQRSGTLLAKVDKHSSPSVSSPMHL